MCATCGCDAEHVDMTLREPELDHSAGHVHPHGPHVHHSHDGPAEPLGHSHPHSQEITLEQRVLAKNDARAQSTRGWIAARQVVTLNVLSSPGAGKTTLLERTIRDRPELALAVIEGDQETTADADRISAAGARAVQVNTGTGCHLDADMVSRALSELDPPAGSLVFIENVGNLVCPALFDLGENARVLMTSGTEGPGKPRKYPHAFRSADLVLLNKADLLPYLDFDVEMFRREVRLVNPSARVLEVSATAGTGLDSWYSWLLETMTGACVPLGAI